MALFSTPKTPADAPKTPAQGAGKDRGPDVPMPDGGPYKAKVVHVINKRTANGKPMFSLKWEDEFQRTAWQNIIISEESEKAMKFFFTRLMPVFGLTEALIAASSEEEIANDMMGTEASVTIETEEYNGKKFHKVRWLDAA